MAKYKLNKSQISLIGMALAIAAASFLYRVLVLNRLEQTSALFIGIPTLLAIGFTLIPPTKHWALSVLKGTLIALCLSGIILSEGFICIIMAAPLFILVALLVGWAVVSIRSGSKKRLSVFLLILPMTFEGVTSDLSFPRQENVVVQQIVPWSSDQVATRLSQSPDLSAKLPFFLQWGFPRPQYVKGTGLEVGATRCILFAGGEGKPGELCLAIKEVQANKIVFQVLHDKSHIAHWLTWQQATVSWKAVSEKESEIQWSFDFLRQLDPAWYFRPFERYGVHLAGEYLLKMYFGNQSS